MSNTLHLSDCDATQVVLQVTNVFSTHRLVDDAAPPQAVLSSNVIRLGDGSFELVYDGFDYLIGARRVRLEEESSL